MAIQNSYRPGDWKAVCFRCGHQFLASEMRRNWQGFWTCRNHWEPRQPQDFVRGVKDNPTPPWTQPPPADVFVPICSLADSTAIPGLAIPGCVCPSNILVDYTA